MCVCLSLLSERQSKYCICRCPLCLTAISSYVLSPVSQQNYNCYETTQGVSLSLVWVYALVCIGVAVCMCICSIFITFRALPVINLLSLNHAIRNSNIQTLQHIELHTHSFTCTFCGIENVCLQYVLHNGKIFGKFKCNLVLSDTSANL